MNIDKDYKGRVRIVGEPGTADGYHLHVYDSNTGEAINNVYRALIALEAGNQSKALIDFYVCNESGGIATNAYREAIRDSVTIKDAEIDIEAWLLQSWPQ